MPVKSLKSTVYKRINYIFLNKMLKNRISTELTKTQKNYVTDVIINLFYTDFF